MTDVDPLMTTIGLILCLVAAAISWIFVYVYSREPFDWTLYEAGRHLMRFTLGLAVILTWSAFTLAAQLIWGRPDWIIAMIEWGRLAIFGWAAWMLWTRLQLLLDAREENEPERREPSGRRPGDG